MSDQNQKGVQRVTPRQGSTSGSPPPSVFDQWKAAYCKAGYSPLRIEPGTKACRDKNWQTELRPVLLNSVNPGYGIGLLMGTPFEDGSRLGGIDVDRDDLMRPVRALLKSPCERLGSKGGAIFVRTAGYREELSIKDARRRQGRRMLIPQRKLRHSSDDSSGHRQALPVSRKIAAGNQLERPSTNGRRQAAVSPDADQEQTLADRP
jgi:hypothetical protein